MYVNILCPTCGEVPYLAVLPEGVEAALLTHEDRVDVYIFAKKFHMFSVHGKSDPDA